ncbi:hypothetical protein H0H93_010030 [Arthromyces matolae]|nr:hypothetical protein H0H93_010030 [Arthromyces matolae]
MPKSKPVKRERPTPARPPKAAVTTTKSFPQEQKHGGLLVTAELQKALEECKSRVEEIAADCRKKNRKFRDVEFDLELDRKRCLHGLDSNQFSPSDVQRVTQIFSNPSFFIDGADSNDLVQGAIGDYHTATVNGLMGAHAYSVLRAVEYNGKRFVVVRNPWGASEWTGPWSDGSKEWTEDWLPALKALNHAFGNDGEFVMEYKDFLENWEQIDRTLLFDNSWTMSSQWLKVETDSMPSPWTYGDVSFTISVAADTPAVVVLSKLDERYWEPISSRAAWSFDFIIYKKGEGKPITTSSTTKSRSVNAEIFLEAAEYVVHDYFEQLTANAEERTFARVVTEKIKSLSIASNFLPLPLRVLAGKDLSELEAECLAEDEDGAENGKEEVKVDEGDDKENGEEQAEVDGGDDKENNEDGENNEHGGEDEDGGEDENPSPGTFGPDDDDVVYLGLRVYTNKEASAKINGQLRHLPLSAFASLGQA